MRGLFAYRDGEGNLQVVPKGVLLLAVPVACLGMLFFWPATEEKPTDRKLAYGCFRSDDAAPISVRPEGIALAGCSARYVAPFQLAYAKGYQLRVGGSYVLTGQASPYRWEPSSRGWTNLLRFRGRQTFAGNAAEDPSKLDEFDAVTEDSRLVRFRRTSRSACPA